MLWKTGGGGEALDQDGGWMGAERGMEMTGNMGVEVGIV